MAAFPVSSLSMTLLDIVERLLYGHGQLSFRANTSLDQERYESLYTIIEDILLRGSAVTPQLKIAYDYLREHDQLFNEIMPDIPSFDLHHVFHIVALLQSEWVERAVIYTHDAQRRMGLIAMFVHAFYNNPAQLINVYRNLCADTNSIYRDVYKTIATLSQRSGDTSRHPTEATFSKVYSQLQIFTTTSNYVKNVGAGARLLCLPSIIKRLGDYVSNDYGMGAIVLDVQFIADLLLLFTVQKMVEEPLTKRTLIQLPIANDNDSDDEYLQGAINSDRTHRFMTITEDTVAGNLLDIWIRVVDNRVVTKLIVHASIDNQACVDALLDIVNRSPFLQTVHFTSSTNASFIRRFVDARPHLASVNVINQKDKPFRQLPMLNLHNVQIDVEEFHAEKICHQLNENLPLLEQLNVHVKRSINWDITSSLNILGDHPSLKNFTWSVDQSARTSIDVYRALDMFIKKKADTLESIRITSLPEDPGHQEEIIWETLLAAKPKLLTLFIGLSTNTVAGQNISKYLQKNRENKLSFLLQAF